MSLLFKHPLEMAEEFKEIHPDLRSLLVDLAAWSDAQRIRPPVVTELARSRTQQVHHYVSYWTKLKLELVTAGRIGHGNEPEEFARQATLARNRREAGRLLKKRDVDADLLIRVQSGALLETEDRSRIAGLLSAENLLDEAQRRFTWHEVKAAADLRSRHYVGAEVDRVMGFIATRTKPPDDWELLRHNMHAPHIHVARCDDEWRKRFLNSRGAHA